MRPSWKLSNDTQGSSDFCCCGRSGGQCRYAPGHWSGVAVTVPEQWYDDVNLRTSRIKTCWWRERMLRSELSQFRRPQSSCPCGDSSGFTQKWAACNQEAKTVAPGQTRQALPRCLLQHAASARCALLQLLAWKRTTGRLSWTPAWSLSNVVHNKFGLKLCLLYPNTACKKEKKIFSVLHQLDGREKSKQSTLGLKNRSNCNQASGTLHLISSLKAIVLLISIKSSVLLIEKYGFH